MTARQKIAVSAAAALLALFSLSAWLVPRFEAQAVEHEAAWDDLLQAARSIRGDYYAYGRLGPEKAIVFIEENRDILAAARQSSEKEFRVPVKTSREWLSTHMEEMAKLKKLIHSIVTEGKVAEARGQIDQALTIYLDGLKLSYRIVRGGIALDYLNGLSYRALVLRALETVNPELTRQQCQHVLLTLDNLEKEQESLNSITLRDRAWRRKTFGHGILPTLKAIIMTRSLYPELNPKTRAALEQRLTSVRKKLSASIESNSSKR